MFGLGRSPHEDLAKRVDQLGIDSRELGARAHVDPERVANALESDIDLEAILSVREVKRIVSVLEMDFLRLFAIPCAFCKQADQRFAELRSLPRNELIARRRGDLGLMSQEELLAKLGITDWFRKNSDRTWAQNRMRLWRAIEERPDSLDDLSLDQVRVLNRVLVLPVQLLLGVQCRECGS
jgi:predicted transcriptional regulator